MRSDNHTGVRRQSCRMSMWWQSSNQRLNWRMNGDGVKVVSPLAYFGLSTKVQAIKAISRSSKDDENVNSQPFMRWRNRFVFCAEPIYKAQAETGGFTANTILTHYYRDNGLLLPIHRAMHAVIDRQKKHGMHFRVLAKALRISGGYHIHSGTVVGKLEGKEKSL
ncbi:hypothetical protein R6Q57_023849 [Mikania cordata]